MWSKYNVFLIFFYFIGVIYGILNFKLVLKEPKRTKKTISLQIYGFCLIASFIFMTPFGIQGFQGLMSKVFKSANHTITNLITSSRIGLQILVLSHFYVKIVINKKIYEDLIKKLLWIHNEIVVNYQKNLVFPVSCERIFHLMILKVIILEMIVPYSYTPYMTRIGNWKNKNLMLFYSGFLYYGFSLIANLFYLGILYMSHVFEILNLQLLIALKKAELLSASLTELLECSDQIDKLARIYSEVSDFLKNFIEFIGFSATLTLLANFLSCVGQVKII